MKYLIFSILKSSPVNTSLIKGSLMKRSLVKKALLKTSLIQTSLLVASLLLGVQSAHANLTVNSVVQVHATHSDGTESWLQRGTGQTRYSEEESFEIGQALTAFDYDFGNAISAHSVLNYQTQQNAGVGVSQMYLKYKPVWSPKYRPTFKVGIFYPEMSFENTDTGWLSPYTYSFSAINSWIAEEQRTGGLEVKLDISSGKRAANKFSITGALYKGNDTLGTMLAWRGWAIHDRQSVLNETILFDTYPSIGPGSRLDLQAAWAEPSREIDGNIGFYLGGEWNYRNKSRVKYFYYDNRGEVDHRVAEGGQFPWATKYHSLAWQYRLNKSWRLLAQTMHGDTEMWNNAVKLDFAASYLMLNFRGEKHRVSLRYDWFETVDRDGWLTDLNDGDGDSFTIAYKYDLTDSWRVGAEFVHLDGFRANRAQWPTRDTNVTQKQWLGVLEYRF